DKDAAERGADDTAYAEDRAENPHVPAALARRADVADDRLGGGPETATAPPAARGRDDVADDRLGADHETATAQSLNRAERDQLGHGMADPGQHGADEEDHDRGLEEGLAA